MFFLVTGASGFVGTRVKKLLIESGISIRILSRKPSSEASPVDYFLGDITNRSDCFKAVEGVDGIIHIAGEKRISDLYWEVNCVGTENLLAAAVKENVTRFVHVSSVGVIGADPLRPRMVDESSSSNPQNEYERSKSIAENLVRAAGDHGLSATILRPANIFGDRDPERGLLTLIKSILHGRFAFVGGRGALCNYVFVEDVAHAIVAAAIDPRAVGHTFHLSDTCTVGEFVDALADELGVDRPAITLPGAIASIGRFLLRGARRVPWFAVSPTFARVVALNNQVGFASNNLIEELGFRYPIGWKKGAKLIVKWYRSQGEL